MATIPVVRKRPLPVPIWVIPVIVLLVAVTAWIVVAGSDETAEESAALAADTTIVVTTVPTQTGQTTFSSTTAPPPAPTLSPSTSSTTPATQTTSSAVSPEAVTQAAVEAGAAAGAAAGRQAALASAVDLSRAMRESAPSSGSLNGRAVQLSGVRVSSVVSDRAFYVGTGADRVLVVMDPTGGDAPVRAGQQISLTGSLEAFGPGRSQSGVPANAGESGYVVVTRPGGVIR